MPDWWINFFDHKMAGIAYVEHCINLQYEICDILSESELSQFNISSALFNATSGWFTTDISEVLFYLCLYNYHSPLPFKNLEHELDTINDILKLHDFDPTYESDIVHLLSREATIDINNPSELIQYIMSSLYTKICDSPFDTQPDVVNLDMLNYTIKQILSNPSIVTSMCSYFEALIRKLNMNIFTVWKYAPIHYDSFGIDVNHHIPFYFITNDNKKYIAKLQFVRTDTYDRFVDPNDNSSISKANAELHLLTKAQTIDDPDTHKLITIFPFQNKIIKFYHDPMISQLQI